MRKINIIVLFLIAFVPFLSAQQYLEKTLSRNYSQDEVITLSSALPFDQAINLLSKLSEKTAGIKIVLTTDNSKPIGVEITNMYYLKALDIIVKYAGLVYEKKDDMIIIKRQNQVKQNPKTYASINSREVTISAVFFESDVNKSKELGLDWKFLLSKDGLEIGGDFGKDLTQTTTSNTSGKTKISLPKDQISTKSSFGLGGFFGEATSVFRYLESENVGEIISSPNITVRDRVKGKIQVGSDFSVKQKDFSGNVVTKFFPTGTIIEVTPYVYKEDSLNYILLDIKVERSSFAQNELTSVIKKTSASTQVTMLNGEETVIGGLFTNQETKERAGVPILKDLPWWFFGLRYIFGSDKTVIQKKELVILIKVELVPTLKERVAFRKKEGSPIENEIKKNRDRIRYYKFKNSNPDNK
ncbi:MAG TPA: type II and III secretion system protein [Ignavibacteria bacterium]|mgnify:CR=1 FL=1|nr:type II and III secretion system protein [Ignavibacteria bacterium]